MRSIYVVPFASPLTVDDHWEIPLMGGRCRILSADGRKADAIEVTFEGDPVENAPSFDKVTGGGEVKGHIQGRDPRLGPIKRRLEGAMAFLNCLFDIELALDETEVRYEAETPDEEARIAVTGMKVGRQRRPLPLTFDFITRALMAAETGDPPFFVATLAASAKKASSEGRFIDSFRYAFLLFEALYGEGQFKKAGLTAALYANAEFLAMVRTSLKDPIRPSSGRSCSTSQLLASNPTPEAVIAHMVEQRGFYFHGNLKRGDAWKPHEQDDAEALAWLAISIVQEIGQRAMSPVHEPSFARRHFEQAMQAGAKIVFQVDFTFQDAGETFQRKGRINFATPGTKVTGKQANAVAQEFLRQFEYDAPAAALQSATCIVQGAGEKVFEIKFHV